MERLFSNAERAEVLVQALPNIRQYTGSIVVIKYGGNAMINSTLKQQVMEDIVLLHLIGVRVVLIHGGGPEITETMKLMGRTTRFIDGLRVTEQEDVDIVQMVLAGKINKSLVTLLQYKGANAVGLSGMDGGMLLAEQKNPQLGYVGKITQVNIRVITDLLDKGYLPVISTLGCDTEGHTYNINGDTAAASIAGALQARRLIMMTDVAGILRDANKPETLIPLISVAQAQQLKAAGLISGGMIPKLECCINALNCGVRKAIIMDGRIPHAILMELLTDEGAGTMISPEI